MIHSSLDDPDDPDDRADPSYSTIVAEVLRDAYQLIGAHRAAHAEDKVSPFRGSQMTSMQRIRLLYVLALSAADRQHHSQAIDLVDEALDLALRIEHLDACAHLAYLGASVLHNRQQFASAARYYAAALDALRAQRDGSRGDSTMEFDVRDGLSTECFLCGRYDLASRHIRAARRLTLPEPQTLTRAADLEWTSALLARWRGAAERALRHALAAYDVYAVHGSVIAVARLRIVLADIALDLAMPSDAPPHRYRPRDGMLAMAEPHVLHALAATRVSDDAAGEGLALLAYARYCQLSGKLAEALHVLDFVESLAFKLHDVPLLSQVHTGRGAAFATHGDEESSLACFRATLDVLHGSSAIAYAKWARRALRLAEEM